MKRWKNLKQVTVRWRRRVLSATGWPDSANFRQSGDCFRRPGTDVMIFRIFSPKNGEKMAFWLKTKLNYAKNLSYHWFLRKTPFFRKKLSKIAENCDHNIDPWLSKIRVQILGLLISTVKMYVLVLPKIWQHFWRFFTNSSGKNVCVSFNKNGF
jgi:hypothetical protein